MQTQLGQCHFCVHWSKVIVLHYPRFVFFCCCCVVFFWGGVCLFHLLGILGGGKQKLVLANCKVCFLIRNSAVETVEQELLFVGSETGKLLAMRELIKKVYFQINFLIKFTKCYIISGRLSTIPISYLLIQW